MPLLSFSQLAFSIIREWHPWSLEFLESLTFCHTILSHLGCLAGANLATQEAK